ncbi:SanA/YdcF family protein [Prescottella agglutinans]|uniref:SanA protein n=1 Tax=Prescottella agglutinans TaxID=1644129 RepID=A0ABT6M791_9NOCA|nr:ElyC/SanA/YdcF family protein [Prescottella agglutinans]MDH6279636.1 SanA protein [Prescottella agglutinans]
MPRPNRRDLRRIALLTASAALVVAGAPAAWIRITAAGHLYDVDGAPDAPVAIVLGARVRGGRPMKFLRGRLDATAALVRAGAVSVVLVSGDARGRSGDEIAAMTEYLVEAGVDPRRIVADPYGLDTYDTCVRAARTFGIRRALVVTQPFHLPRTVALARRAGIDADGVRAGRAGGRRSTLVKNSIRELLSYPKAARDVLRGRDPKVVSAPVDSVADALAR